MSPPYLTGNAPVLDIFKPVEVYLVKTLGNELCLAVLYRVDRRLCQRLHLNEPLCRYLGLYGSSAAVAGSDIVAVFLDLNKCALSPEILNDSLSCLVAIHSCVLRVIVYDSSVIVHNVDNGKVMAAAYLKVIRVVGRSYLNYTCSEIHFNVIVRNDRYLTVNERKNNCLADKRLIALVIRVYCNCRIAEERFGTSCCKFKVIVRILYLIAEVPEVSCLILVCYLSIGKRSPAFRTPVDYTLAAVNQTFFVVLYENLLDRL